jgi:hypothetical protein
MLGLREVSTPLLAVKIRYLCCVTWARCEHTKIAAPTWGFDSNIARTSFCPPMASSSSVMRMVHSLILPVGRVRKEPARGSP